MAHFSSESITDRQAQSTGVQNFAPALFTMAVLYFMMGFITVLNDTLVPFFKMGFTLSYAQSSLVQFYFFLTYGVMSIPAGNIVSKLGYKKGIVLGFLIAGLGALLFFPAAIFHQYYLFLGALFIIAIGIVLLQVAANPYITVLGPAETASSRLTLIQGVGSIGTTVAPFFGAYFILSGIQQNHASSDAVKYPYLFISLFLFLVALAVSRLRLPDVKKDDSHQLQESFFNVLSKNRNLKFGVIALFCYVGAEVAIGTFLTNYIAERTGMEEMQANNYVSIYWGSMLVGRFLGAVVLRYITTSRVLMINTAVAIFLIVLSLCTSGYLSIWAMIGVGLCNSIMFAAIFSLSVYGLGANTTKASGLLSTAIVGGAVIPYIQGLLIDKISWEISFIPSIFCYIFVFLFAFNRK